MTHRIGTLGFAAALLFAASARAQISSPPPPNLQGQPAVHAWTVPGVVSNAFLSTAFGCTNTLSSAVIVGVEVFGPSGGAPLNDASATSVSLAPGATAVLATSAMASFSVDSNLALAGLVAKGSARVLTTAKSNGSQGVLCGAILAEFGNNPTWVMTSLPVIRKTTQQGD